MHLCDTPYIAGHTLVEYVHLDLSITMNLASTHLFIHPLTRWVSLTFVSAV